jgi:16S rRNA (uracil1498-N3)-methyltransferase
MSARYFVETPVAGDDARLEGAEAHHLAHVMRAKVGDEVTLFDGSGAEFIARAVAIGRSSVDLAVLARRENDRESARRITLAVSLPKGDRQRWLVEKATELGVVRLVPLVTERSVAQPVASALARLRRTVIEASKQCGRNRLMQISDPFHWRDFVADAPANALRWIAHPLDSLSLRERVGVREISDDASSAAEFIFAVGPEGGFADDEVRVALDAGWQSLSLGPRILRVETAAIALASWAALTCGGS